MKVILIDDESIALDLLRFKLSSYKDVNIVGSYTNPLEALKEVKKIQPDVIFLDIEMGEVNGLEVAELFTKELAAVEIVFITAYSKYAVDAFEINAIDYLLKPVQEKRLNKTIERLRQKTMGNHEIETLDNGLKVNSFGTFQVLDSMDNPLIWRTQKSKELFAFLWNKKGEAISKMLIMDEIFPDKNLDKATTLLHTTIYQLRKNLEKLGYGNGIIYFNESYQLNVPIVSDVEILNKVLSLKEHGEEEIKEILRIYKGDFLGEEGYLWAMGIRKTYEDMVFNILNKYAGTQLREGKLSPTLKAALDSLYKINSFNEDIVKMIIYYYGIQRNRASLKEFFEEYVVNIKVEMQLSPMEDTLKLYKRYMDYI
ncbi:response regulator [Tissierella pigra]|uniref:response regulator n=1 Tax=Tissierella pigra TaxID=2607614 RepID=UPI001C106BBE|nr:response regulator [Tissierella pigra]MBU5428066.1 response regulator [Tissierella pigra]